MIFGFVFFACKQSNIVVPSNSSVAIIPQPKTIKTSEKGFDINQIKEVVAPPEWKDLANLFNDFHQTNQFEAVRADNASPIEIKQVEGLDEEAYKLSITSTGVAIQASNYGGAFNGIQTLKQLLLNAENSIVMQLEIEDQPRFKYRGLMLDCSRHFWTVDELKETISQMAFFKLNKLHLTDNNAWRVEIKAYPKLITAGTYYKDYPELSDKFYTQEDLKEVVAFAGLHNIEVIPEIDIPGHAIGILAAYPELACTSAKKEFEVYPEEMPIKDRKHQVNMLCIGNPDVYTFSEKVIQEMAMIFPSKNIHLGGDEVPTNVWETCDRCKKVHQKEEMLEWGELQDYFTKKMSALTQNQGKTMLGWDEINDRHAATTDDVVMVWRNYGFNAAVDALKRDVPIIMAPQHGCYYDWGYAGNSTRKVYEWNPISNEMNALHKNHLVLGGQACLWTERVPTQDRIEYMLYPRLTALAEVLWSPESNRNWESYLQRLEKHYPIMEQLGINYYVDEAINEKEFKPSTEKPALMLHAQLTTNIRNHGNYHLEYIFDGRSNTFYWGGRAPKKGDWYQITLGEPVDTKEIIVITGDSKDYLKYADVLISEDGDNFNKIASFDEFGEASATLNKTIKAVRIEVTKQQTDWPIIKEVIIK